MKSRRRHTWKANKASTRPRHVIFVDTETNATSTETKFKEHTLKLGYACYQNYRHDAHNRYPKWHYFTEVWSFWDFVVQYLAQRERLYLVGHGAPFDMGILQMTATAKERGWKQTFYHCKGSTLIVKYHTGKGTLCILSTTNFFPMTLKTLGALVGMEKGKVNFDTVSDSELKAYCKLDVQITMKAWDTWITFLDDHDLGNFQSTIASQAFNAYRHRFMSQEVWIHGNMKVCQLERDAYRGGRCEVFRVGEFPTGEYIKLDVNGLYGHVMSLHKLPFNFYGHRGEVGVDFLKHKLKRYAVIARVVVNTDFPVFPVKRAGINCYQTGIFETVLTTPELKYALKHCDIQEVKKIAWYEQAHILQDYAFYFAKLKDQYSTKGNKAFRKIAKLFNNALYGKLAQRDYGDKRKDESGDIVRVGLSQAGAEVLIRKVKCYIYNTWDRYGEVVWKNPKRVELRPNEKAYRVENWSLLELLGKKPEMRYTENQGIKMCGSPNVICDIDWQPKSVSTCQYGESYNSFPAISAHVTAYARLYLWELMVKAGRENVFYCDTDGFITNQVGLANCTDLMDDHKQGRLKVEDRGNTLTIWRRKGYMIDDKRTICGIRKNAVELSPLVFEQDQFLGAAGAIRQGNPDLRGITRVIKHVGTEIKGGVVESSGWVTPFRISL